MGVVSTTSTAPRPDRALVMQPWVAVVSFVILYLLAEVIHVTVYRFCSWRSRTKAHGGKHRAHGKLTWYPSSACDFAPPTATTPRTCTCACCLVRS